MKQKCSIVLLFFFFLFIRLSHLTLLPIFNDEATYLYWTKIIETTHQHWFIPLIGGKGPLFIWIEVLFLRSFPAHFYLFAGRLTSVFAGLLSCIGIYYLTLLLTRKQLTAFFGILLYTSIPFMLMYDRIALFDSLLTASLIWIFYFAIQSAQSFRLRNALLWGICMAFALATKFSASIFILLSLATYFLYIKRKDLQKSWKKSVGFLSFAFVFPFLTQLFLSRSNGYSAYMHQIIKYTNHGKSFLPLFSINLFTYNITTIFSWLFLYLTPLFFLLTILSLVILFVKERKLGILCISLTLIPFFLIGAINIELSPRYILSTVPFFIISASWFLVWIFEKNKYIAIGILFTVLLFMIPFDYSLLQNPIIAPFPQVEKEQFITHDPSGFGLQKIFFYIHTVSQRNKVSVVTLGTEGLFPYAFNLEFWDNPNVTVIPIWPVTSTTASTIQDLQQKGKVLVIIRNSASSPDYHFVKDLHLHVILTSQRPGNISSLILAQPE